jgi:hypothetical protein
MPDRWRLLSTAPAVANHPVTSGDGSRDIALTSPDPCRHETLTPRRLRRPYYLPSGLLIVLDGGPGKTTQIDRLRTAQTGRRPLFANAPLFIDIPTADDRAAKAAVQLACAAAAAGRPMFAERWDYRTPTPDLLLLLPTQRPGMLSLQPDVPGERIVPIARGHEGQTALSIWTAMAGRGMHSTCPRIRGGAA